MKRYTKEATDENVLESIKNNTLNRAKDVKDFIEILESIEGNMFIGLDAKWGAGKTFYVRQIEKTLEYLTKKILAPMCPEDKEKELECYFEESGLKDIELEKSYFPIYYDAWLYDNHSDPLMSLIFSILKGCKKYIDAKIDNKSLSNKVFSMLGTSLLTIQNFQIPIDISKIKDEFLGKDILNEIQTVEEIREKIKEILNEVITEEAQRLVIFIDELDRCRPNFAIEMLERIKHYFDDDRIIFVFSVNKEALTHTISKYYGNGFDSSDYLNRFFDFTVQLPQTETESYFESLGISCTESEEDEWGGWKVGIESVAYDLQKYYNLSIRNTTKFFRKINAITEVKDLYSTGIDEDIFIVIMVAIICVLDLVNIQERERVLNGLGAECLKKIIPELNSCVSFCEQLSNEDEENRFESGFKNFINMYELVFKWEYDGGMRRILKDECIRLFNLN